jgi:hypothetical protein
MKRVTRRSILAAAPAAVALAAVPVRAAKNRRDDETGAVRRPRAHPESCLPASAAGRRRAGRPRAPIRSCAFPAIASVFDHIAQSTLVVLPTVENEGQSQLRFP